LPCYVDMLEVRQARGGGEAEREDRTTPWAPGQAGTAPSESQQLSLWFGVRPS